MEIFCYIIKKSSLTFFYQFNAPLLNIFFSFLNNFTGWLLNGNVYMI